MHRQRILVVDDEASVRRALRTQLGSDYEIVEASNGVAALAFIQSETFDAIISDQRMPGIGGAELLERAGALHPQLVRILLSGEVEGDDAPAPGDPFKVTKPWNDEIATILESAFERRDEPAAEAEPSVATIELGYLAALERRASLGTMARAIIHDLASVVQGLQCALDEVQYLVRDQLADSPELREAMETGVEMSTRMTNVFRATSTFLRTHELAGLPTTADVLVHRAVALCNAYATHRRVALRIGTIPMVEVPANDALVVQVLINLIRNAIEASPPDGTVDVEFFEEDGQGRFRVTDDGPGVPSALVATMMERSVTGAGHGGVGLPISAALMTDQGGSLRYRRAPGRGSEFEMCFPTHAPRCVATGENR